MQLRCGQSAKQTVCKGTGEIIWAQSSSAGKFGSTPSLTPCPGRNKNCPPSLSILNIRHYDDGSEMKRKGQKLPRKYQNPAQQQNRKPKNESVRKRGRYGGTTGNQDLLFDDQSDLGQLSGPISIQTDECLIKHSRR